LRVRICKVEAAIKKKPPLLAALFIPSLALGDTDGVPDWYVSGPWPSCSWLRQSFVPVEAKETAAIAGGLCY
jgi:hypothetical protein